MALGWLCTAESMPSICLLYGFGVALGGLPPFLVQGSRFEVQRSTFSLRPEPQTQESRLPPVCRKMTLSLYDFVLILQRTMLSLGTGWKSTRFPPERRSA